MKRLGITLGAALLLLPHATPAPAHETAPLLTNSIDLEGGEYSHARLTGAWKLESPSPEFGGVSGLLVEEQEVMAITDQGWWLAARRGGDVVTPEIALMPMTGANGQSFDKSAGDAEGLSRRDGRPVVSFERDHRIAAHIGDGQIGRTVQSRAMERLGSNTGMEALATLPDGRLIAIAEKGEGEDFPVFVVDREGKVVRSLLPRLSRHDVTGADIGPDGKLYLLQRHFSILTGFSIRVVRYHLGEDGLPDPRTAEVLAAWESPSGIDNMEGIAAFRDNPAGPVKLWLISDDNYNALQRTILVELEVE